MAWYTWVLVIGVLAGAAWLWSRLYRDTSVVSCIGCGKCAATGECVYVQERRKGRAKKTSEGQEDPGDPS